MTRSIQPSLSKSPHATAIPQPRKSMPERVVTSVNVPSWLLWYNIVRAGDCARAAAERESGPTSLATTRSTQPSLSKSPHAAPEPMSSGSCEDRVPLKC